MRRAFTLVELLVCLAIVTTLVALLGPALGGARSSERNAACLSRLHEIGGAYAAYHGTWRVYPCNAVQLNADTDGAIEWICPGDPQRGATYRINTILGPIGAPMPTQQSWSNRLDAEDRGGTEPGCADPFSWPQMGSRPSSYHGGWFNTVFLDGHVRGVPG